MRLRNKSKTLNILAILFTISLLSQASSANENLAQYAKGLPINELENQSIYFIMTDRFNNGSSLNDFGTYSHSRMMSGVDKSDISFFHGGDFLGITEKLDYLKNLGFTAIWVTPPVKNYSMAFNSAA